MLQKKFVWSSCACFNRRKAKSNSSISEACWSVKLIDHLKLVLMLEPINAGQSKLVGLGASEKSGNP